MKVADYIIRFIEEKGITDIYGYPGGMINHFVDSASKSHLVKQHLCYNEQGGAIEACGYAQSTNQLGAAYSTSGPGATNLITGIANAYYDYIPTLFLTGNVERSIAKGDLPVRQIGFQETDILSMVSSITKWAATPICPEDIRYCLERAYYEAFAGPSGPVVLDIPNDISRADVDPGNMRSFVQPMFEEDFSEMHSKIILSRLRNSKRPIFLFGAGVHAADAEREAKELIEASGIPCVFSMTALDLLPYNHPQNFGFIGTNGHRYANTILGSCDLVVILGCRLSIRHTGIERESFAAQADIIRCDVDTDQLALKAGRKETTLCGPLKPLLSELASHANALYADQEWMDYCVSVKALLQEVDIDYHNTIISEISDAAPEGITITADVGQNLIWTAESFHIRSGQRFLASGGLGAMGYSIPAAIGASVGTKRAAWAFCGDGGLMMNVQELQFINRERLPIKIFCLNNHSLGMMREWQNRYMDRNYAQSVSGNGYLSPNMEKLADAFSLRYSRISGIQDIGTLDFSTESPELIEIVLQEGTSGNPYGPVENQMPELEPEIIKKLSELSRVCHIATRKE